MKTSQQGIVALVIHEGIVPGPYLDSRSVWTYGVGHTAAAGAPEPAKMPRGMPADLDKALRYVFALFVRDLAKYEREVTQALRVPVAQYEFDALVSFHYNTGGIKVAALTRHLNAGFRLKAANAFMGWSKPKEVIDRRKDEQALFGLASLDDLFRLAPAHESIGGFEPETGVQVLRNLGAGYRPGVVVERYQRIKLVLRHRHAQGPRHLALIFRQIAGE